VRILRIVLVAAAVLCAVVAAADGTLLGFAP
jgi:hypothetical protein